MFPLGSVLFPTGVLPLRVFEPRYQLMTRRVLDTDLEFGVVLIERGSEVGGDDVRTDVGTIAQVVEAAELGGGRWTVTAIGTRRIRVVAWLPDDPYPCAEVEDWPDPPPPDDLAGRQVDLVATLRRVLALKAELGEPAAPAGVELAEDPVLGGYQVAAVAPFGPLDRQRLLAAPDPAARADLLAELLADEERFLRARLDLS
jgi:Lon protease-like protein